MARSAPKRVVMCTCVATSCGVPLYWKPPDAAVQPLGVLAHDDEVDVLRALVLERAVDARVELHRPQVDVLVELEAQPQQDALLEDARRDVRVPDGAEVDGVEPAQLLEDGVGQDLAGPHVALAAEVELREVELDAGPAPSSTFSPSRDDLGAGAVAGEDGYAVGHGKRERGNGRWVIGGEFSRGGGLRGRRCGRAGKSQCWRDVLDVILVGIREGRYAYEVGDKRWRIS